MTPIEAKRLIREKLREERNGVFSGETAFRYKRACAESPATMMIAHIHIGMQRERNRR